MLFALARCRHKRAYKDIDCVLEVFERLWDFLRYPCFCFAGRNNKGSFRVSGHSATIRAMRFCSLSSVVHLLPRRFEALHRGDGFRAQMLSGGPIHCFRTRGCLWYCLVRATARSLAAVHGYSLSRATNRVEAPCVLRRCTDSRGRLWAEQNSSPAGPSHAPGCRRAGPRVPKFPSRWMDRLLSPGALLSFEAMSPSWQTPDPPPPYLVGWALIDRRRSLSPDTLLLSHALRACVTQQHWGDTTCRSLPLLFQEATT